MSRQLWCALAVVMTALLATTIAHAQGRAAVVDVRVVDVAGDLAYLQPGGAQGLRAGAEVRIARKRYRIVAVTQENAVVRLDGKPLRIGARGKAEVVAQKGTVDKLPAPTPLEAFRSAWGPATLPASTQTPTPIPIGAIRAGGPTSITLSASSASWLPLADTPANRVTRATVRAQLQTEPFGDVPFGFDADVAASRWFGRGLDDDLGADSRPIVEVQELRARYGPSAAPFVGLGRLRYAALTVGLLDGARVASPSFGGVRIAGFGGVVPNSLDGALSTDLGRFGAEVSYDAPKSPLRPSAELVVYGSTFDGSVDERRAAAAFQLFPGRFALSGHAELSMFDSDNPWGSNRLELTAGGVDAALRLTSVELALSFDAQQPERSRWLASLLPPSWLCTASPQPATDPPQVEPCDGSDNLRYYGLARAGLLLPRLQLQAGGTVVGSYDGVDQLGGFLDIQAHRLWRDVSVSLGGLVTDSPFVESGAARIALAAPVASALDIDLYYRPALLRYRAATDDFIEHRAGLGALMGVGRSLTLSGSGEIVLGDDVSALGIFATAIWRASL